MDWAAAPRFLPVAAGIRRRTERAPAEALRRRAGASSPRCQFGWRQITLQVIPDFVKAAQRGRRLQHVKKCLELGKMRLIALRVHLPDEGLAGP